MVTILKKQVVGSLAARAWDAASAFFVFFFTGIFASIWHDVPFVYPTETFPLRFASRETQLVPPDGAWAVEQLLSLCQCGLLVSLSSFRLWKILNQP